MDLQMRLNKLGDDVRRALMADMHRMASGWAGRELPTAPMKMRGSTSGPAPLKFSWRSRQRLGWMGFMMRIGH